MSQSAEIEPRREPLAQGILVILRQHQYALGYEGIACDGEVAWLQCTCGWKLNYEMPEDDIRLAERQWDQHRAKVIASALMRGWNGFQ